MGCDRPWSGDDDVRYISTRGSAPELEFQDAMLAGLASDGGLYVPATWPQLDPGEIRALAGRSYPEQVLAVTRPLVAGAIPEGELADMVEQAYAGFKHAAVVPLKQLAPNAWLLELFHGPTLAFKDVAMQLLARLIDYELKRRGERATIIGATSGDTGAAAVGAFSGIDAVDVFILHPKGRVSEVQRRQMTTVDDENVHNIALEGTFDDCQSSVKGLFGDHEFRDRMKIAGVNSINWARVMAQMVYYFSAAVALGAPDRAVSFVVPTGNFGDIFAGYAAKRVGLPVERLAVATNVNDILTRVLASGRYKLDDVVATMSPSMDIQISSNFERVLFDALERDADAVSGLMQDLGTRGGFSLPQGVLDVLRHDFDAARADEQQTLAEIKATYEETGEVVDPHTAVGLSVARSLRLADGAPVVTLATAHPAKFPDAVNRAVGFEPKLPPHLADLYERRERFEILPNSVEEVRAYVEAHASGV